MCSRLKFRLAKLWLCALLIPMSASANVWRQSLSLPVEVVYDSNPAMATQNEQSVWLVATKPAYGLNKLDGNDELSALLSLNIERSSDESVSAHRADPSLLLGWLRKSALNQYGLRANYQESSTRVTELQDTGQVDIDGTRQLKAVYVDWKSEVSDRINLQVDGSYEDIAYRDVNLTDYSTLAAAAAISYAWDERTTPFVKFSVSNYEPKSSSANQSSELYGATIGAKWLTGANSDLTGQVGLVRTVVDDNANTMNGGIAFHYALSRSELTIDVGRSVVPSGGGGFTRIDQARFNGRYAIDEKTQVGMDLAWLKSQSDSPWRAHQFGVWLNREMAADWGVRFFGQLKQLDRRNIGDSTGNVVGVAVVYSRLDF